MRQPPDRRRARTRLASAAAGILVLVAGPSLTGCSDPLASPDAASTSAPLVVTPDEALETVEAQVGQSIVVGGLEGDLASAYVESDDPSVAFPVQPDGAAAPGVIVVGPGTSFVTVWDAFPSDAEARVLLSFRVAVR